MQNWNSDPRAASSNIRDAPVLLRIAATRTDVSRANRTNNHIMGNIACDIALIHLRGFRLQILLERNLEVEELLAIRIPKLVQVQLGPAQRVI